MVSMRLLSLVGNSFGCSASGERLVSAARDGDLQEAKALLEYNPRLVRYSTFGVRNSPLHYSAAQGHHEIVSLLVESGVDINLRNYRGQTALMQACQIRSLGGCSNSDSFQSQCMTVLSVIHRADYLNGGTALHLAALNGHSRCIRLLLSDYVPSIPNFYSILRERLKNDESISEIDDSALYEVINRPADGGVAALHMAALNGHVETVQLLLALGAFTSKVTVEDGTTIDLIGPGSTPLHYAACGGSAQCCQLLIARGASLTAENANGWTPLTVARSWRRDSLEEILSRHPESQPQLITSPYLCLPLKSIVHISRECGWRGNDTASTCIDPCVVCLERKCTVAAEGCLHEFCTHCALYLCSSNSICSVSHGPLGSIACPLCRRGIISFVKLPDTRSMTKDVSRTSLSLNFCTCSTEVPEPTLLETPLCKPDFSCARISPLGSSFRSVSCQSFPSVKLRPGLCMGDSDTAPSLVPRSINRNLRNQLVRCSRSSFRRSTSQIEGRRWLCSFSQSMKSGSTC